MHTTLAQKFNPESVFAESFAGFRALNMFIFPAKAPRSGFYRRYRRRFTPSDICRHAINRDIQGTPNLVLSEGRLYQLPRASGAANAQMLSFETFKLSLPVVVRRHIRTDGRSITHLRWNNTEDKAEIIRRINLPLATLF